jgi:hypothetical protein
MTIHVTILPPESASGHLPGVPVSEISAGIPIEFA